MSKQFHVLIFILSLLMPYDLPAAEKYTTRRIPQTFTTSAQYDEFVIDTGMLQNCVSNRTIGSRSGSNYRTFLIGRSKLDLPSMAWSEGGYDQNHYLYFGRFLIGFDNDYIRFSTETSNDFKVSMNYSQISPIHVSFSMTDELTNPDERVGIKCICTVHAWEEPYCDDFFIYTYEIINQSGITLDPVYAGLYMDYDVSAAGGGSGVEAFYRDDMADYYLGTDQNGHPESISYMYDGDNYVIPGDDTGGHLNPKESFGYIGSRILESPPSKHGVEGNKQSGHDWFDWCCSPSSGSDFYMLMSQEIFSQAPPSHHDYRILQTIGPWYLPPEDTLRVAFALGIGDGLRGLRYNLQNAFDLYWHERYQHDNINISSWTPQKDTITIQTGNLLEFSIDAESKTGNKLDFIWNVDGLIYNFQRDSCFVLKTQDFALGFHEVIVTVTGDRYQRKHRWFVKINPKPSVPKYSLYSNYPNPFNNRTVIPFEIEKDGRVEIGIYDTIGRPIKSLHQGDLPQGKYEVTWNGTDDSGNPLPGGCYFYQIRAGDFMAVRKMLLLK